MFESFRVAYTKFTVQPFFDSLEVSGRVLISIYFGLCSFLPMCFALATAYMSITVEPYYLLRGIFVLRVFFSIVAIAASFVHLPVSATIFLLVNGTALGSVGRLLEMSLAEYEK